MSNDLLGREAQAKLCRLDKAEEPHAALLHELQVHQIELEMQNETLRQTLLALEESRDRYLNLYDFAPVGYVTLNEHGLITEINRAGAALLRVERQNLINRRFAKFAASPDSWHRYCLAVLNSDLTHSCELQLQRDDETVIFVRLDGQSLESGGGGMRITLTDITERKQLENKNEQSKQKLDADRLLFQAILDNSPIGIWMLGADHKIKFINQTFCHAVGFTEPQFVAAHHYSDLLPPDVSGNCMKSDCECFDQETPHFSEEYLPFVDGRDHLLQITKAKIFDDDGRTIGLIGLATDITEQRRAEMRLIESEEKFRAIFEGTFDGVVLIDDSGLIVDFNAAFIQQCGLTSERLKHTRLWELRPAGKVEVAKSIFFEMMRKRSGGASDFKYKKPDGQVMHIGARGVIISIGGKDYLQCITHDITERKRTETELLAYQQLLRQMAAQGVAAREDERKHIAREVHDELGQLLTALRMDISLMRIQFGGRNTALMPKIQGMLTLVDKAIRGVRDVSANLHPPALDMGLVASIRWLTDDFTRRTSLACIVRVDDEPSELDDSCTLTLFRIVQESLTNVTRYAQAGRVDITLGRQDERVTVEIRDDGAGFDLASVPSCKTFGLMGMRERALAVGGRVEVTSTPGQGTTVFVAIPFFKVNPGRRQND